VKRFPFFSVSLILFILAVCFIGPLFYTQSAYLLDPASILLPPSWTHGFGTDRLGRDVLARVMQGGQVSLIIGIVSVILIDLFLTFPTFFLLLALISYMNASMWVLIIIIAMTGWMGMARMIRSESFALSHAAFIKILKIANVPSWKIIVKYFTPLLAPIFFISFTFGVSGAILAESGLSFLGIGITPPQMSWGVILSEGKEVIDIAWWLSFFPGLFIFLMTLSLVSVSDYLQAKSNEKESATEA